MYQADFIARKNESCFKEASEYDIFLFLCYNFCFWRSLLWRLIGDFDCLTRARWKDDDFELNTTFL